VYLKPMRLVQDVQGPFDTWSAEASCLLILLGGVFGWERSVLPLYEQ